MTKGGGKSNGREKYETNKRKMRTPRESKIFVWNEEKQRR